MERGNPPPLEKALGSSTYGLLSWHPEGVLDAHRFADESAADTGKEFTC